MRFFLVLATIGYNVALPWHFTLNTERQICSETSLDWTRSHYLFVTECWKFDGKVSGGEGGGCSWGRVEGEGVGVQLGESGGGGERRSTTTTAKC